jgi:PAS domain S-box-containing protein
VKKEIGILILEDIAADAVRINHELRRGGLNFSSTRVETRENFMSEIEHHRPDIILSDHGLPSFDGFTALDIVKQKCPEIPFIFVTGSLGEEFAINTFKHGATDYVLKNRLSELVPAVQRALREREESQRRQQAEKALAESGEGRYRRLIERCPDALLVIQTDDQIVFANPAAVKLLGAGNEKKLIGKNAGDIFQPDPWDTLLDQVRRQHREKGHCSFVEQKLFRLDGNTCNAEICATPTVFDGKPAVQILAHDISDRVAPREAARQSDALKAAIFETALDAIISICPKGSIQEWNPAAERIFGYDRTQVIGRLLDDLIVPASLLEVYREGLANYLATGAGSLLNRPIELKLRRVNGEEFPAELAITHHYGPEEQAGCTVLVRDITERKKSEQALRESEERFRMMVEGIKDYAIYMLDQQGRVATWNSGAEAVEGFSSDEIIGKPVSTFFTSEDVQKGIPERYLKEAETTGKATHEGWRVRKDGTRFWSHGTITALRDEDGHLCGFAKIAHDMTQSKRAEEEIRRFNVELEERVRRRTVQLEAANKELEAFSYSVSHDLRAPLRHIVGYVDILQSEAGDKLDDDARSHLQTISDAAHQMGNLIDALLDFSRMGRTEMRRQRVSLAQLVEDAQRALRPETQDRQIEWKIGPLPEIEGDPVMLQQVVVNLVSNALKYTRPRKKAQIEIGSMHSDNKTIFFIRDNGVGFDMSYADKLFGVFQRLHPAREFEGTGIGLANVRRIVHRHGGRVWAESAVDRGATFYFSIPTGAKEGSHDNEQMDSAG